MEKLTLTGREASLLVIIGGAQMYVEGPMPIALSGTYTLSGSDPAWQSFIRRLRNKDGMWMKSAIQKSGADPEEIHAECEALAKRLEAHANSARK